MKKQIYQIFGLATIFLLLLGLATGNNESNEPEIISEDLPELETEISIPEPKEDENSSDPDSTLIAIDEVEFEKITKIENNYSDENDTIVIPLENITQTENNTTKINSTNESTEIEQIEIHSTNTNTEENKTNETQVEIKEETKITKQEIKKIRTTLSKNEKIELEGDLPENFDVNSIEKKESTIDASSKEVIVKSEEHLADPLTVYTDIPQVKKSQISYVEVYWVNEKKEVEITGFYDLDENGLYDRISWVVPHLSEQIFEVRVNLEETNNTNLTTIELDVLAPSGTITTNFVEFNVSLNYTNTNLVECNLSIYDNHGFLKKTTTTSSWESSSANLTDGEYSWQILCYDAANQSINASSSGSFIIEEGYTIEDPEELYVLDWNNNLKGSPDTQISVSSINSATKEVTLKRGSTQLVKTNLSSSTFDLSPYLTQEGTYTIEARFYRLKQPVLITKSFSVAKASITYSDNSVDINQNVDISVTINSPVKDITTVILDFGDGSSNIDNVGINTNSFVKNFPHTYDEEGSFTVELTTIINGVTYTFTKNGITVTDPGDNTKPKVTLLDPDNNEVISASEIEFTFKVDDNEKVKNCTYEIYMYDDGIGTLEYTEVKKDPKLNTKMEVKLKDFEEAEYSWNVYCCDDSGNCNGELDYDRDLTVDFDSEETQTNSNNNNNKEEQDYPEKDEIADTINRLENFVQLKNSFSPDQEQALMDLGLDSNITFFQKRLFQIDQDLATNIHFISDESLKTKRRNELVEEYFEIKRQIPTNFKVKSQEEYTKNSITKDLEELIKEYSEIKNLNLNNNNIENLAELNLEIQNYLKTKTLIKKIEIDYIDKSEDFTLVTKILEVNNESFETILEVAPNLEEIEFLTETETLKDGLHEIQIDSLEEDKIIYKLKDSVDTNDIKETDTIVFKNFVTSDQPITGFFLFGINEDYSLIAYIVFAVLVLVLIWLGRWLIIRSRLAKWKKEENVTRTLESIEKAKKALAENNIEDAKTNYRKMQELYKLVPEGFKKYSIKEFKKIQLGIDRREIIGFVKEYEQAKAAGRKEDEKKIYEDVRKTYKRLPKKDQEKIYNKMFKNEVTI